MNFFTVLSFILALAVFGGGLYLSSPDLHIFYDTTSLFIVFGGSLGATALSFGLNKLFQLTKVFFLRTLKGKHIDFSSHVTEIIVAVDALKKGKSLNEVADQTKDFFFKEGLMLIQDGLLSKAELLDVLQMRNTKLFASYSSENGKLKSIGKFPPAFGMIGTTIGMIVLLANLGGEDAMKKIGPAMGVCLITTLYGAALANIFLIPMAENMTANAKEIYAKNEIAIEGLALILDKANPVLAAERLNSYLNPGDRVDWKEILKK